MTSLIVRLDFDEKKLCEGWMNIYNLGLLLYSEEKTTRELLTAEILLVAKDAEVPYETV
jgi:hypothetical protein